MNVVGMAHKFDEGYVRGVNNLNTYLFIGDSKASGGVNTEPVGWDPKYTATNPRAIILHRDDRVTGDESTLEWLTYDPHMNRAPGYGPPAAMTGIGYDNSFMWYMRTNLDKNVGLMKWALGGTTLMALAGSMNDWNPGTNEMYRLLVVDYANLAHGRAIQAGYYGSDLKAVFVSLGTNDCLTGVWNNAQFTADLSTFVAALRRVFGKSSLPIYWQQVRADLSSHPSGNYTVTAVTQCRTAITNYAAGDGNFHVKDYEATTVTSDGVHEDVDACEDIGIDLGGTFILL